MAKDEEVVTATKAKSAPEAGSVGPMYTAQHTKSAPEAGSVGPMYTAQHTKSAPETGNFTPPQYTQGEPLKATRVELPKDQTITPPQYTQGEPLRATRVELPKDQTITPPQPGENTPNLTEPLQDRAFTPKAVIRPAREQLADSLKTQTGEPPVLPPQMQDRVARFNAAVNVSANAKESLERVTIQVAKSAPEAGSAGPQYVAQPPVKPLETNANAAVQQAMAAKLERT